MFGLAKCVCSCIVLVMPTRWKTDRPMSRQAFDARFRDEDACAQYLADRRWPEGFVCPSCGTGKGWPLKRKRATWECAGCARQTSVTAGTVMHARIASPKNVPEASCRCLTHLFPRIFARGGVRFGGFQMTSDARSLQIAQRVRGHLRLRVLIGAEHQ